eukprot:2069488-Amphidinium_carterae.1
MKTTKCCRQKAKLQVDRFKPPPPGVKAPWERVTLITPVPSTAPGGVKTPFKGPPKNHPDYKEVTITYLPFTPKKPPPQMPGQEAVVPQKAVYKPPPAPGYSGLTKEQYDEAQAAYERDLANRRDEAN